MRKFGIVLICVILFCLAGPVALAFNVQRTIFSSPQNIKNTLVKIDAYDRITSIRAEDLIALVGDENRDPESQIPPDMVQKVIDAISPDMAQRLTEQALSAYFSTAQEGGNSFEIDLREVKTAALASQPPEISTELSNTVPDFYQVRLPASENNLYKTAFSYVYKYMGLAIILFLMIIAILLGFGAKGKIATLATAVLMLAVPVILIYFLGFLIPFDSIASSNSNAISQSAMKILQDFARELWQIIAINLRNQGLIALALAIVLYLVAIFIPAKKEPLAMQSKPSANHKTEPADSTPASPPPTTTGKS